MSSMTARAALAALALLACAPRAGAAVIEGRISHPSKPGAVANLRVEALGLDAQEHAITRETRTDQDGHYRFADLPTPAAYLVRAQFGGLTFPGGSAGFRQGEEAKSATIDFKVYDQSTDPSQLQLSELQWVIVKSAGVWRVQQSATVANPGNFVVTVPPGAPTPIRVGLAPGHGRLDTVFGRLPEGATVVGDTIELRGPVLPGDQGQSLQLEYDLVPTDGALQTAIAVPAAVDNLAVYVQDFGIDVDAGELHPARPARQDDLIYQTFIGFDVPAGTSLPLRIRPLPPTAPLPQALVAVVAALGAGALFFFVIAPIVRQVLARGATSSDAEPESPAKAALAAALLDLEHDFETGKLSEEDRERLRADLRREALAALARERLGPAEAVPQPPKPCSCGRMPAAGDRFCASCGSAL